MEDFATLSETITEITGMQLRDARGLTGHGADAIEMLDDKCYANTPIHVLGNLKRTGRLPSHRALYNDAQVQIVRKVYEDDFALYEAKCGNQHLLFQE